MKVGFTGTQAGMTIAQYKELSRMFDQVVNFKEFHHGDCVGADEEAAAIVAKRKIDIVIHPPTEQKKRAFCMDYIKKMRKKPYLERNHDIVDATNTLFATPKEMSEQLRSGTWATIRYAIKQRKRVIIVYPDGTVEEKSKL